jgi:nucleoid DNA-binding protein
LQEDDVHRLLAVLGPEIQAELASGKSVTLSGLGTIRVVQIPEHRDLGPDGRPVTVPAVNTVEFLPDAALTGVANSPTAVPAATVPNPTFQPFPNQTRDPGQKVPPVRQPNVRTKS